MYILILKKIYVCTDQPLNLLKTKPWIHDQAKSNRGDDLFRKECLIGKTNFMVFF